VWTQKLGLLRLGLLWQSISLLSRYLLKGRSYTGTKTLAYEIVYPETLPSELSKLTTGDLISANLLISLFKGHVQSRVNREFASRLSLNDLL
jgi:hypothetical protein